MAYIAGTIIIKCSHFAARHLRWPRIFLLMKKLLQLLLIADNNIFLYYNSFWIKYWLLWLLLLLIWKDNIILPDVGHGKLNFMGLCPSFSKELSLVMGKYPRQPRLEDYTNDALTPRQSLSSSRCRHMEKIHLAQTMGHGLWAIRMLALT